MGRTHSIDDIRECPTEYRFKGDSSGCFTQGFHRRWACGGDVRGEDDIRHRADRMFGWNRFGIKHIKRGTAEMTGLQRFRDRVAIGEIPTAHIDKDGACFHLREHS